MKVDYKFNDKSLAQLCKYIMLSAQHTADIIDDAHVASDTCWSSYAVNEKMIEQLAESKEYSEELVAGLTKLRVQVVSVKPTLATTEEGIIYLYSATGSNPYDQYLKVSSTQIIFLGSTDIDIDQFYTKVQSDARYASASTVNLLSDAVTGKVAINQGKPKAGQMLIVDDAGLVSTVPFETADIAWT